MPEALSLYFPAFLSFPCAGSKDVIVLSAKLPCLIIKLLLEKATVAKRAESHGSVNWQVLFKRFKICAFKSNAATVLLGK